MLVDIENFKSALAIENILAPYKKGRLAPDKKSRLPKEKITPDVCMEILKSTNYARNIKDMLLCIAELPLAEQEQFKDVVLATFTQREQPKEILDLGLNLAKNSSYVIAYEKLSQFKDGYFYVSSPNNSKGFVSSVGNFSFANFDGFEKVWVLANKDEVFLTNCANVPAEVYVPYAEKVALTCSDLRKTKRFILKDGAKICFNEVKNLPLALDLSNCSEISVDANNYEIWKDWKYRENALQGVYRHETLSGDCDFSKFNSVKLISCDLSFVKKWHFKEGARVYLESLGRNPQQMDFSQCDDVYIKGHVFDTPFDLKLKKGGKLLLDNVEKLASGADVSLCREVILRHCDLRKLKQLVFAQDAKVCIDSAAHLPPDIDFSACDEVELNECDLKRQTNLHFKKGAKVILYRCDNLLGELDFSQCSEVRLYQNDLDSVKRLVFRDTQQFDNSFAYLPDNWKGRVVYKNAEVSVFKRFFNTR